jgi:RNA polymerase sigma factor (sigma-70 family)
MTTAIALDEDGAADDDFTLVIRAQGDRLHGLVRAILGGRADAEDAYQAALLRAWRRWGDLRDPGRRPAWLATICVREALRLRRRLSPLPLHESAAHTDFVAALSGDADLAAALRHLSPRQRAVVALHYGHGFSLDELASILGCSGGAARSHLTRALRHLRRTIDHD